MLSSSTPLLIKKYSNRRLYDTAESRYVTVEELAEKIRRGTDVRVQDAQNGDDLTQALLTQMIMDGRGAARLLPVPLLLQLIRMGDDALAEFLSRYLAIALEAYLHLKSGAQRISPYVPFSQVPLQATSAFARLLLGMNPFGDAPAPPFAGAPAPAPPEPPPGPSAGEVAEIRRELDELKRSLRRRPKR